MDTHIPRTKFVFMERGALFYGCLSTPLLLCAKVSRSFPALLASNTVLHTCMYRPLCSVYFNCLYALTYVFCFYQIIKHALSSLLLCMYQAMPRIRSIQSILYQIVYCSAVFLRSKYLLYMRNKHQRRLQYIR